jgi:hypothetical protein
MSSFLLPYLNTAIFSTPLAPRIFHFIFTSDLSTHVFWAVTPCGSDVSKDRNAATTSEGCFSKRALTRQRTQRHILEGLNVEPGSFFQHVSFLQYHVVLTVFSYAVSTDVIICNGRLRNDYGCRVWKGFAGSGCGPLSWNCIRMLLEALKNDAEPPGVAFRVWSSWSPECESLTVLHLPSLSYKLVK